MAVALLLVELLREAKLTDCFIDRLERVGAMSAEVMRRGLQFLLGRLELLDRECDVRMHFLRRRFLFPSFLLLRFLRQGLGRVRRLRGGAMDGGSGQKSDSEYNCKLASHRGSPVSSPASYRRLILDPGIAR